MDNSNKKTNCAKELRQVQLQDIPSEHKKWKYLQTYREEWRFLPYSLRSRVAEQLMLCDYLISIELWLCPGLTIKKKQDALFLQLIASIYEGVLNEIISKLIDQKKEKDPIFKTTFNKAFYGEKRTFSPIIKLSYDFKIIDAVYREYLENLREARNWIHLTNEEKSNVLKWIKNHDCLYHRRELNDFKDYIKKYF